MKDNDLIFCGFQPIFNADSKILILGSFPSIKSRDEGFYYGNPKNRFWKILGEYLNSTPSTIEEKKNLCLENGIALWDIVASCRIEGSLDSNIKDYTLVDLNEVLDQTNIVKMLCNGAKSFELTRKAYSGNIEVIKLPSTSPANVRFAKESWFEALKR